MQTISKVIAVTLLLLAQSASQTVYAQSQEKRLALVVGNGAYQKGALPTAANDAGLVAQTLQAAGFDVVGARDLDGETLRRSFRDFIQKVQSSGADTVAFVYLAGYGMQLTGENYFAPIDANIARDTDVPIEALRISDYSRQLAALPLKVGVIVLDAARSSPFAKDGQPLAGGLALVEPESRMLIAFNSAPGTVGPEGAPPYGAYAQALAEMIRAGGLTLPEVFDRVRLRVNEMTGGAEIPWDAQKIDNHFVFFERAPDAPAVPDQTAALRSKPIRDFDAKDAYTAALDRDTLQDYESFLVAYPNDPLADRVRAIIAARREAITWRRTYRADTPPAYWSYLARYPRGPHAWDARRRLAIMSAALEPPRSFAAIVYDVPPPPPEEIVYIDRPVLYFSDPVFAFAPPPPPPLFFLPRPPPDFIVLAPPPLPIGLFVLPTPLFVAMPLFVRAPSYIAPPPNNIIFANIHNTTVINNVINKTVVNNTSSGPAASGQPPVTAPAAAASLPAAAAQKASLVQSQRPQPATLATTKNSPVRSSLPGSTSPAQTPTATTGSLSPAAPQNSIAKPLPGPNGQPLPKPTLATAPAVASPLGAKLPVNSQPSANPNPAASAGKQQSNVQSPNAPAAGGASLATTPKITPTKPLSSKPPDNTANVNPAKPPSSSQPLNALARPEAVRAAPSAPASRLAAPPRPQVQPRDQQQAQRIQAPKPPVPHPPAPSRPACKPGQNCKH
jgi:uncharacterized caspase-like protein